MDHDSTHQIAAVFPNYCSKCELWSAIHARITSAGCTMMCTTCGQSTFVRGRISRSQALVEKLQRFAERLERCTSEHATLMTPRTRRGLAQVRPLSEPHDSHA